VKRLEEAENILSKSHRMADFDAISNSPVATFVEGQLLQNDLDTPGVIQSLNHPTSSAGDNAAILKFLGFGAQSNEIGESQKQKVNQRLAFIADKNWTEADRIRDELLEQGIQLKDGKDPETGERITTWEVKR
jgi:cysteinyl-tRNA synthetase